MPVQCPIVWVKCTLHMSRELHSPGEVPVSTVLDAVGSAWLGSVLPRHPLTGTCVIQGLWRLRNKEKRTSPQADP